MSVYSLPLVLPPFRAGAGWGIPFQLAPVHAQQGALCCPLLATAGLTNPSGPLRTEDFLAAKVTIPTCLEGGCGREI